MVMKNDKLMSLKEVCKYLGLSRYSLYRLARKGKITGFKIGGAWRFKEEEVEACLERNRAVLRTPSGMMFSIWVLTPYHQAPLKYQIAKKGSIRWLSLREEYIKKLPLEKAAQEYFKPVKYRKTRVPATGENAVIISPRYFTRLPNAEQNRWLKFEVPK